MLYREQCSTTRSWRPRSPAGLGLGLTVRYSAVWGYPAGVEGVLEPVDVHPNVLPFHSFHMAVDGFKWGSNEYNNKLFGLPSIESAEAREPQNSADRFPL